MLLTPSHRAALRRRVLWGTFAVVLVAAGGRYAWLMRPAGETLTLNRSHQSALPGGLSTNDDAVNALTPRVNRTLDNIDEALNDAATRDAIRAVQPACARIGDGSGVAINDKGDFLTAAHVARSLGSRALAFLPDGRRFTVRCTAINVGLDCAIMHAEVSEPITFARLAPAPPGKGDAVVCIGNPGEYAPDGKPTGYKAFHVSTGKLRGFQFNRVGDQTLGRAEHDAWTYWGHSGAPLFDPRGRVVAMHNSWDEFTGMRRAVTHEAIERFLTQAGVKFEKAEE